MIADFANFLVRNIDGPLQGLTFVIITLNLLALRAIVKQMLRANEAAESIVPLVMGHMGTYVSCFVFAYALIVARWWPQIAYESRTLISILYSVAAFMLFIESVSYATWVRRIHWFNRALLKFLMWSARAGWEGK